MRSGHCLAVARGTPNRTWPSPLFHPFFGNFDRGSQRVRGSGLGQRLRRRTVDRHRANILQKQGLRDRLALTRYAIRAGLTEP